MSACPLSLDTTSDSFLHRLFRCQAPGSNPPNLVRVYLMVVAFTYLPLFLAAKFGPVPLWDWSRTELVTFLQDWGLA